MSQENKHVLVLLRKRVSPTHGGKGGARGRGGAGGQGGPGGSGGASFSWTEAVTKYVNGKAQYVLPPLLFFYILELVWGFSSFMWFCGQILGAQLNVLFEKNNIFI